MATYSGHTPISSTHDVVDTPYFGLSAEELMEKGVCPIKRNFFKPRVEQSIAAPEAVNLESKVDDKDKIQGQEKQLTRNEAKKQIRKGFNDKKNVDRVCHSFLQGECRLGDACKFNHDIDAFVKSKPKDLEGTCPFAPLGTCPFGITCRFATTHVFLDSSNVMQQRLLALSKEEKKGEEKNEDARQEGENKEDVKDKVEPSMSLPLTPSPAPSTFLVYPSDYDRNASVLAVRIPDFEDSKSLSESDLEKAKLESSKLSTSVPLSSSPPLPAVTLYPYDSAAAFAPYLHLSEKVERSEAALSKECQRLLWSKKYDYSKAEGVLENLGLKNTFQNFGKRGDRFAASGCKRAREEGKDGEEKRGEDREKGGKGEKDKKIEVSSGAVAIDDSTPVVVSNADNNNNNNSNNNNNGGGNGSFAGADADVDVSSSDTLASATASPVLSPSLPTRLTDPSHPANLDRPIPTRAVEIPVLNFRNKTYLAPLTTVGNLPFRRICKRLGVDITCGEMAMATNLLQGQQSEWALLKRHPSEDLFGVQICGGFPDLLTRCAQLVDENVEGVKFFDINMGCPIDLVCDKDAGSALLRKPKRIQDIIQSVSRTLTIPLTVKIRRGFSDGVDVAHTLLPYVREWGAQAVTLHGRSRQQRYTKLADWEYVRHCSTLCPDLQLLGNGDVMSFEDWNYNMREGANVAGCMIGRGALIKPWIFTEIKEQRYWDIRSGERLDILRGFVGAGLEHWGSDAKGVANTRKFLMEWLSFACRYVPVGLLDVLPQKMNHRPLPYYGRDDLETLMARADVDAWNQIANLLLGPPPEGEGMGGAGGGGRGFSPKHKSNSYSSMESDSVRG